MKSIRLSPSAINVFLECPKCFWMDKVQNIKRPRGIFPSLPSGMDREIKIHFDKFRMLGTLPQELSGPDFVGVRLFDDQELLEKWRSWRTGLVFRDEDGSELSGALDDLLVLKDQFIPFDYKTKGSPTTEEDAIKYYSNQMDCYALLLDANKLKTTGFAFLLYYSPKGITENGAVTFQVQPIKIKTDPSRALATVRKAVALLKGPCPKSSARCEYCLWLEQNRSYGK
jgi:hypothetical protein